MNAARRLGFTVALGLVSTSAFAAPKLADAVQLGERWYGPERRLEDLAGRVVLIEDWGYR